MPSPGSPELGRILGRNIEALLRHRDDAERHKSHDERVADAVTAVLGSLPFVIVHAVGYLGWILVNTGALRWLGLRPFDPALSLLSTTASVEAIFLSAFILIRQNRMQRLASQRTDLDLQINLLAEREITRLLGLASAIADHLHVSVPDRREVDALREEVPPEAVLEHIERVERERQV